MRWIFDYQLFLFDLDGLLVNTEELHYKAYKRMLHERGYELPWDFLTYFQIAQQDAEAPKRHIYAQFPRLEKEEPRWEVLYAEKKKAFLDILQNEPAPLLPGARTLLQKLEQEKIKRCVVTHSAKSLIEELQRQNPILQTISHWFTREDYNLPKPAPDGYLKACTALADPADRIIGFEDSSRGMQALMGTKATPILVNAIDREVREKFEKQGVRTFKSLEELCQLDTLS